MIFCASKGFVRSLSLYRCTENSVSSRCSGVSSRPIVTVSSVRTQARNRLLLRTESLFRRAVPHQIRMVQGVAVVDGSIINKNPATGEVISRVPCTPLDELDVMIREAKLAQKSWATTPVAKRIQLLRDGLQAIEAKSGQLARCITTEMGKPIAEAREEVEFAVGKAEYLTLLEASLQPQQRGSCTVIRQSLGVVTVLSPWNFPADEILLLLLPALGSGNTAIVKPSEVSPETGAIVVNCLAQFLPENVLQLAQGDAQVGAHLVSHKDVDMVAMTGSSVTGQKILTAAAPHLKRFVLEMGGKDPMVVFDDADLNQAAKDAVSYSLSNTGQVCCSIERIYVAQTIYREFQERVTRCAAEYHVGNGMDENVNVGPLVSIRQRDHVKRHVEDAIAKGAKVLHQSKIPSTASTESSFFPVTVLADVKENMHMYHEETFGPVVALTPFDGSEEEAIRLANDTEYGLASCVYTQDMDRAQRVASAIEAGQIGINCYSLENMDVACPWVGHKKSGFGYHSGQEGFHQFSIPKTLVYVPSAHSTKD
jgi:succinate-semialdehyde dehydrogenase/glutarate-semialdehyde dehydrogenase